MHEGGDVLQYRRARSSGQGQRRQQRHMSTAVIDLGLNVYALRPQRRGEEFGVADRDQPVGAAIQYHGVRCQAVRAGQADDPVRVDTGSLQVAAIERQHRGHVSTRGVSHQDDALRIAAVLGRVPPDPGHGLGPIVEKERETHLWIEAIVRQHRDVAELCQATPTNR
jgi:hypothetical protein